MARRVTPPAPDQNDVLDYLESIVSRLERLGDRFEAYADDSLPLTQKEPDDSPPSA